MTCEEFEELSGAYILDAVTPAEREAAEEHLATCMRCTRLLQELHWVVSLLPLSVPQVKPSAALKDRILARIAQERAAERSHAVQPPGRLTRRQRWTPRLLVAAAVLMFCLLSGMLAWNVSLYSQVGVLQQQLAAAAHQTHPPTYTVQGTGADKGASGQLIYYPAQNITVLIVHGLSQLQGVQVYQGWLLHLKGNSITGVKSIGLLNVENGSASLSFEDDITGFDATAISQEPGPVATANAPKGKVIALGSLQHTTS